MASIGEGLFSDKSKDLKFDPAQALIYLRIWPTEIIPALSGQFLNYELDKSVIEPLCGTVSGWSNERNRFGRIAFACDESKSLYAISQVFKNGEIWGVNRRLLRRRADYPNFVPMDALKSGISQSLDKYILAAQAHFGYGSKVNFQFGLVKVVGFRLAVTDNTLSEPIFEDVKVDGIIDMQREDGINTAKELIFRAVYDAAGLV